MKKISKFEIIFFIAAAIKIIGLIYKLLLTRILTLEGMRIISMILPTLSLMLSLSSFSVGTVVNQNCAAKIQSSRIILKSALNITLTTSTIISIILILSFPIYTKIYQTTFIYFPLLFCIPLIYFSNINGIIKGYLEANNKHTLSYISNIIEQLFKFFITFFLLFIFKNNSLNFKIILTFLSLMLSEISAFLYLLFKLKNKYNFKELRPTVTGYEKNILKQATPLTIEQLLTTITTYLEPLLFYYAMTKKGFNLYDSTIFYTQISVYAIPLILLLKFGVVSISKFSFPFITKNLNNNKCILIISNLFLIGLFSNVINMVIVWFYPEFFLKILYDDISAINLLKPLSIFVGLSFFNPVFIITLQSIKEEKKILISSLISSFILISSIIPLTYYFELKGYIISIILSYTLKFLILLIFCNKYIKITYTIKQILFIIIIIFVYLLINCLSKSIFILILSTLFYGVLILLYFWKNRKELTLLYK